MGSGVSVWGISWGGSWDNSWGPLHAVEQEQVIPEKYGKTCTVVPSKKRRTRKPRPEPFSAGVLLDLGFSVASISGISITSYAEIEASPSAESSASILIGVDSSYELTSSVKSESDIHDIVLEMLLLAA